MKLKDILEVAIKLGVKADLRGEGAVKKHLDRQKKKYESLSAKAKEDFDKERLTNPYMDTGIWVDNGKQIKKAMAAVDITSGDILVAKEIGADCVINHHPHGKGLSMLGDVMHLQADILAMYGVPINVAESLLHVRISEVARGVHAANHYKTIDAARLVGMNLMNVHTPADNLIANFIKTEVEKKKPEFVGDLVSIIKEIPEYKRSAELGVPVRLFSGSEDNHAGKVAFTELTGGTEGSKHIYAELAKAGVGTIVGMHLSEEHRKNAEEAHINVVIAPHIASDSLGMNLFLDELEKRGVEIVPFGGLIRVKRFKK